MVLIALVGNVLVILSVILNKSMRLDGGEDKENLFTKPFNDTILQDHNELLSDELVHRRPDDHHLVSGAEPGQGVQSRVYPSVYFLQDWSILYRSVVIFSVATFYLFHYCIT